MSTYQTQWERVRKLIVQGQKEGVFRTDVDISLVQNLMLESMQMMHRDNFLQRTSLSYRSAIAQASDIIVEGICIHKE